MKRKFEWLKCKKCDTILERMYSNDQLDKMYPVDDDIKPGNKQNEFNMKMFIYGKKLWRCPKGCGTREVTTREFIRMVGDFKLGRYIEYE